MAERGRHPSLAASLLNTFSAANRVVVPLRFQSTGDLHYSFPDANYTPIADYSIWFRPVSLLTDLEAKPQQRSKSLSLCPGSEIRLARPELKRQLRIQLDLPNVRLQDLVESDWQ